MQLLYFDPMFGADTILEENNVTLIGKNVQEQTGAVAIIDSGYGKEVLKRA